MSYNRTRSVALACARESVNSHSNLCMYNVFGTNKIMNMFVSNIRKYNLNFIFQVGMCFVLVFLDQIEDDGVEKSFGTLEKGEGKKTR